MPHHILSLNTKIGGEVRYTKDNEAIYLMNDQARHIYKKVETGNVINVDKIKQKIGQDQDVDRMEDTSGEINPYHEIIANKTVRDSIITNGKMVNIEQCS